MRDFTEFAQWFPLCYSAIRAELKYAPIADVGEWHAQDVSGSAAHVTREIEDALITFAMPQGISGQEMVNELQKRAEPSLPWAEQHFLERVSGQPLNPPPSHEAWPHGDTTRHINGEVFSHTYPERFWPRHAHSEGYLTGDSWAPAEDHDGIRFRYGDLWDLICVLEKNPHSRQAYLPIWFPEDLAATRSGARVPCSLGYHFMMRHNTLTLRYYMRSCEFTRHLRDDIYMAARLLQWVCEHTTWKGTTPATPGRVIMHISSLHILQGDL